MKKFVRKIVLFLGILCVFFAILIPLSAKGDVSEMVAKYTNSGKYNRAPAEEIIPYIEKVQDEKSTYTKLILGDSVCCQLFNRFQDKNEDFATVGSNQAITYAGHYLLAEEFTKSHDNVTDIYLILKSIHNGFNGVELTYQYMVIPFTEKGIFEDVDDKTYRELEKIYGSFFLEESVVELIDYSPILKKIFLNNIESKKFDNCNFTKYYIEKFKALCENKDIEFHLIHAPMSLADKESVEKEKEIMMQYVNDDKLLHIISGYYDSVIYYPVEYFDDGVHLGKDYNNDEEIRKIVSDMQERTVSLEAFMK